MHQKVMHQKVMHQKVMHQKAMHQKAMRQRVMHQKVIAQTPKFLMFDLQEFIESQHLTFCADYVLIHPQSDDFVLHLAPQKISLKRDQLVLLAPFNPFRLTLNALKPLNAVESGLRLVKSMELTDCSASSFSQKCDVLHFRLSALGQTFVDSVPFSKVRAMLEQAKSGLLFDADQTGPVNRQLMEIENTFEFKQVLNLLTLLDRLSNLIAKPPLLSQHIEITNSKRMENKVQQALKYIEDNLSEALSVSIIAKQLYMGESTFSRFFHANIGVSFRQYLIEQRVRQAGRYLVSSDWSIAHISAEVGFSSLSNFNAKFKSIFHVTPKKYRLNHLDMRKDIAHSTSLTGQINKHLSSFVIQK